MREGAAVQEEPEMTSDLNLAGLATIAFLALFLPSTGLIHRRARRVAARSIDQEQRRQLEAIVLEEAMKLCREQSAREAYPQARE